MRQELREAKMGNFSQSYQSSDSELGDLVSIMGGEAGSDGAQPIAKAIKGVVENIEASFHEAHEILKNISKPADKSLTVRKVTD